MSEHNERRQRFVPVAEYQRISGLGYKTIMHMVRTNQVTHITTESGQTRIDTQGNAAEVFALVKEINELKQHVFALCKQFNTAV